MDSDRNRIRRELGFHFTDTSASISCSIVFVAPAMRLSTHGSDFIKRWERLRLRPYPDGNGVLTIGWGHTGTDFNNASIWTPEKANAVFQLDTGLAVGAVNFNTSVPLTQNQFDALVSFTYNVGITAYIGSTLLRLLNTKDYTGAADQFPRWNHDGGKVVAGLTKRRAAERLLFLRAEAP